MLKPANQGPIPGEKMSGSLQQVYVVFTAPPGPGRLDECVFVEVEDADGKSIEVGSWKERDDGDWTLGPFYVEKQGEKEDV